MENETNKAKKQVITSTAAGAVGGMAASIGVQYGDQFFESGNDDDAIESAEITTQPHQNVSQVSLESEETQQPSEARLTESPVSTVENTEEVIGVAYDVDGDGVIDAAEIDTDGDGVTDTILIDADQDGIAEYVGVDTDGDHIADVHVLDTDGDHNYDLAIDDNAGGEDTEWGGGADNYNSSDDVAYDMDNDADVSDWA